VHRLALLVVFLACVGCTRFEHPIVGPEGPALDAALVGDWEFRSDEGLVQITIERDGGAGKLVMTGHEEGKDPETDHFRLITARVGQRTYASLQSTGPVKDGKRPLTWVFFEYEIPSPDLLLVHRDDDQRWGEAVRDGTLAGKSGEDSGVKTLTVTASEADLRAFVAGYGSVIFSDEVLAEFRRIARQ
jgi:hypothetical protein